MARVGRGRIAAASVALVLAAGGIAVASGAGTTAVRTIGDRDGDNRLEPGPGDEHLTRQDLGVASPGRARTRVPLLTFGQLTDLHIVDEESPARVEFLDRVGPPFTSAYRPHEGLTPQVADAMVREMRNAVSPITHRRIELVMTTGDNTDNTQCNETRWMIDILDGAADAGETCVPAGLRPRSRQVDPNSGIEGSCDLTPDGLLYDGVRDRDEYYEPDSSGPPGANEEDGPGYSPDQAENEAEAGRSSSVRDFPGLFERMNEPFDPVGFRDLPWYGIFGNHDGLVQGNQPRSPALDEIARGCVKVTGLPPAAVQEIRAHLAAGDRDAAEALAERAFTVVAEDPAAFAGLATIVPQDERRHLLYKSEYIAQHFATGGAPAGHGFGPQNIASGQGNYALTPRPGLRFVVLDTVAENGRDGGNLDHTQFLWLHDQLKAAGAAGELAVVFGHHSVETMNQLPVSPFPPGDLDGDHDPIVHFGERSEEEPAPRPCALRDPAAPPTVDETFKCLLLRHPSAVAYIAGHEHRNRIRPFPRSGLTGTPDGPALGGFWQVITAAHIDWPEQSRLLDLVDNADGTLSLFGTLLDHAAPPNPGGAPPGGGGAAPAATQRLASISRELSFNDPDAENGEDGHDDARGGEGDRNVELVVRDPRA
jgi:3',5'-cyclic AMP phosphodiesterase CpdA